MRIRDATAEDLPAILDIYNDAVLTTTATYDVEPQTLDARAAWFRDQRARGMPLLVAERAGLVFAWGSLAPYRPRVGYRFTVENSVYVAAAARGQGAGRALLRELIARGRVLGMHSMLAGIDATNEASLRLHTSEGFVQVAHLKEVGWKFERWLDVILLQKQL